MKSELMITRKQWEYDNIFRVTFRKKGNIGQKVNFKALKYGQPSAPNGNY